MLWKPHWQTHIIISIFRLPLLLPEECPTIIVMLVGTNMTVKHHHSMVIQMIKCTQVHSTWITTAIRNTQNTSPEETNTNPQEYTQEMWM